MKKNIASFFFVFLFSQVFASDFVFNSDSSDEVVSVFRKNFESFRGISIKPEDVLATLADSCVQVGEVISSSKKEKKKRKKKIIWGLLGTVLNIASNAISSRKNKSFTISDESLVVDLCDSLFCLQKYNFGPIESEYPLLGSVYALKTYEERKKEIMNLLAEKAEEFLREIFAILFSCLSDELSKAYEYFRNRILEKLHGSCDLETKQIVAHEYLGMLSVEARNAFERIDKDDCTEDCCSFFEFTKAVSGFKELADDVSVNCISQQFVANFIEFLEKLKKPLIEKETLCMFNELSTVIPRVYELDDEGKAKLIKEVFSSRERGERFLSDLLLYMYIFLQEKLADIVFSLFEYS